MPLTLRVLSPDQNLFDGPADEVILPSTTGQLGVLPGHVSMLTALDVGVMQVREGRDWQTIALMGGFAEVETDEVTVLVNSAELGSSIDHEMAAEELSKAREEASRYEGQPPSVEKMRAQQLLQRAQARARASSPTT
jgi:F-type H+-transporting ATPase subunit epsilon